MRENGPITRHEVVLPQDSLLVSQTDPGGRITFANDAFVRVSGFTREELLGAPHNLVRHPHMPQAAFRRPFGQPPSPAGRWEGLVKNRAKNRRLLLGAGKCDPGCRGRRTEGVHFDPRQAGAP